MGIVIAVFAGIGIGVTIGGVIYVVVALTVVARWK